MAIKHPGERNGFHQQIRRGPKLVCALGVKARPVISDGEASNDFARS